jgi:hypothetical protein
MLQLETCGDNWFVIGGGRSTDVEGNHEQWRAVAMALREGRDASFKRVAAEKQKDGSYRFWSPRNYVSTGDYRVCPASEVSAFADQIDQVLNDNMPKPTVVCLCGSTRFHGEYTAQNERLTLDGKIVLSVGSFGHGRTVPLTDAEKAKLDALHLRKIDLADEILVLNVGGYIGDSTRREIEYAKKKSVVVNYLEPVES